MKLSMCPHHLSHKPVDSGIVCTHRQTGPECPQASSCQMYDTQTVIYVYSAVYLSLQNGGQKGGKEEEAGESIDLSLGGE